MRITDLPGTDLTEEDFIALEGRWITREMATAAKLRRVSNQEGRTLVGDFHSGDIYDKHYEGWAGDLSMIDVIGKSDKGGASSVKNELERNENQDGVST